MTTLMFWTLFICILNGWSQLFDVTHPFSNSPFYIHSFPVECWPPLPCFLPPAPYPHHRLRHLQRWWFTKPPVWPHQSNSILGQMPDHPITLHPSITLAVHLDTLINVLLKHHLPLHHFWLTQSQKWTYSKTTLLVRCYMLHLLCTSQHKLSQDVWPLTFI